MKNLREAGIAVHTSRQVRQENFTGRSFCFVCCTLPQRALSIVAGSERTISWKVGSAAKRWLERMLVRCIATVAVGGGCRAPACGAACLPRATLATCRSGDAVRGSPWMARTLSFRR